MMLDIESKKWRVIRQHGITTIENKQTKQRRTVSYVPNANHLAGISLSQFDNELRQAFEGAK